MILSSQTENYRYCLSENDLDIIKRYNKKGKISENAEKSLIILSEAFGGLHHLDSDQLKLFNYQSDFFNYYLMHGYLSTFDRMVLTCLVIMAHDMAVRFEIQAVKLNPDYPEDKKLLEIQLKDCNSEYDYNMDMDEFVRESNPSYIKLLFHKRKREGDFSQRHPTIEESVEGFRKNNKRYAW